MRRGHEGPDVLHLHAGPPLENEGGSRAHVCVSRDGGLCARVVLGGAGEDFVAEAEENNLDDKAKDERWDRWDTCSLCEQSYHGVVACALGWACWKTTWVGRRSTGLRRNAMMAAREWFIRWNDHEAALSVKEAELAMKRRLGLFRRGARMRAGQSCDHVCDSLDGSKRLYACERDVYSGRLKLNGGEHETILQQSAGTRTSSYLVIFRRSQGAAAQKRCPWRDAFSARIMANHAQDEVATRRHLL